jgi:SLT domain-containing protein
MATDWWNPIDVVSHATDDALGALKAGVTSVGHFVRGVAGTAASAILYPIHKVIDTMPQTGIPGTIRKGADQELDKVIDWIKGYDDKNGQSAAVSSGGSIPFSGSGNVASWIMQALQLTGVPVGYAGDVAAIIQFESGGNPNAINNTDSNAQAGDPSRGLMQTIMSTFEAYRLQSLPDNIYDPVANIVAGIRYAISRYGSLDNVPGIRAVHSGGSYVGYEGGTMDTGPNAGLAMLHPREAVLPANVAARLRSGGFGGGVTININNPTVRNDKDIDEIARKVEAVIVQQWLPNAGIQARI